MGLTRNPPYLYNKNSKSTHPNRLYISKRLAIPQCEKIGKIQKVAKGSGRKTIN
jgi:hypothetical protein